jgi:acetolactate synthase-1/2/3 large subunit
MTDGPTNEPATARIGGKRSGARLARYALEQLPVSHTFGVPGVHTTALHDELNQSDKVRPVLVTHEGCGAFAADAVSRTGGGRIGCLVIVPAAGVTHAMRGIGECYLDGVPLLVITGGVRNDVEFGYQLHELDQMRLVDGIVERAWRVKEQREESSARSQPTPSKLPRIGVL